MKRIPAASAVTAVVALTLAGCGGSGSTSSGSANSSATPSSSSTGLALPNLKGQTITVDAEWQAAEQKAFEQVLQGFEQATGATVKYTSTGDNTATVLGTAIAGGSPPDVALIPQPGLIQQFVTKGAIKPLPDSVQNIVKANYSQTWQDLGTFDGKMSAVWFKAANKSTVWYRTAAFTQAGVTVPATWDDFIKALKTIRDSGTTPLSIGGADGWTLTDWFENVYLRTAGPDKYDALTQHKIKWTDPSVTKALQLLGGLWSQRNLIVGNPVQTSFPDSVTQVFGQKKGAVVYEGDFVAGVISASTKAKVGTDANFFPFPSIDNSPPSVVGGGDAAVMMKDTPGAQALMAYLASPMSADVWVKIGGFTSPNKGVPNADYPDDVSRKIAQDLVDAQVFRFDMSDQEPAQFGGTPGRGEWKDLQNFLANPSNVSGTQQQLEKDAAAAYK